MGRRALWTTLGALALLLVAPVPARAAEKRVTIRFAEYSPTGVTVAVGDRILWDHDADDTAHTVTFEDGFDSHPDCSPGAPAESNVCMTEGDDPVERQFLRAGTYLYFCKVHGEGMRGIVFVQGSGLPEVSGDTTTSAPRATTTSAPAAATTSGPEGGTVLPGTPPAFSPDDDPVVGSAPPPAAGSTASTATGATDESAAAPAGDESGGGDESSTLALIGTLAGVAVGCVGLLLWLWPERA